MKKLRILNLPLELTSLEASKRYGYSMSIGLDEAFAAIGADVVTVPALSLWPPDQAPTYWLAHLKDIIGAQTFDQVWVEILYSNLPRELLEFLATIAPVRVGLMTESRKLFRGEYDDLFADLPTIFNKRLPYLTHVLFPDEKDVESLTGFPGVRPVFLPVFVNQQFVVDNPPPPAHDRVTFLGRLLRDRQTLLGHPALAAMVDVVEVTGEEEDYRLKHFDAISRFFATTSANAPMGEARTDYLRGGLQAQVEVLRSLKAHSHAIMMRAVQKGIANLNLRSFSALFSSRVVETMAAGQCVISYRVPERPRTNSLFEPGQEILFFDDSNPESLAEQVSFLRSNPAARSALIRRSQAKVRAYHTTEQRLRQLLKWIETGDEPRYS
jgi:glycosyltransferase involved in cell wall biosynthesis